MTTPPATTTPWPTPLTGLLDGPWDNAFYFTHRGPVSSKSNYRHSKAGRAAWATHKNFATAIGLAARQARPKDWLPGTGTQPLAERPKIVTAIYARALIDVGNLNKTILDAVEATPAKGPAPEIPGIVMFSDAQIAGQAEWATRTTQQPGAVIGFAQLPATATPPQIVAATTQLMQTISNLLPEFK